MKPSRSWTGTATAPLPARARTHRARAGCDDRIQADAGSGLHR
jgi:hypothetical protein